MGFLEMHNAFENPITYHKSHTGFWLSFLEKSILVVILKLHDKKYTPHPTAGQEQKFRKSITYVRYLTDFAFLSRYQSHTNSTFTKTFTNVILLDQQM